MPSSTDDRANPDAGPSVIHDFDCTHDPCRCNESKPMLGLATTRELLTEIKARGEVSHTIGEYPEEMGGMAIGAAHLLDTLPGSMLDYRTVDS